MIEPVRWHFIGWILPLFTMIVCCSLIAYFFKSGNGLGYIGMIILTWILMGIIAGLDN